VDNPDELLCFCNRCTWGQLQKLAGELLDFERVVQVSGACTGCGSCQFDVEALVEAAQATGAKP